MDHDGSGRFAKGNRAGAATQFQKGNTVGAETRFGAEGRSEGLDVWERNAFSAAVAQHFLKHGADVLNQVRKKRPVDYLKFCLQLMPKAGPAGDAEAQISRLVDEEIATMPDGELYVLYRNLRRYTRGELQGMTEAQIRDEIHEISEARSAERRRDAEDGGAWGYAK